jgi:tRNA-Thr(GGU) m(6)t(6)A37 methyltransferase TsaA
MSIQEFIMRPIGVIHTPFTDKDHMPIQASRSKDIGRVEIYLEFADGLKDIENFSHIFLLYAFHHSSGYSLHIKPFLDDQEHGIFATRYPSRPNPIGISIVRILSRHKNTLTIEGVDMLDGTPLLDIKPYVPDFDLRTEVHAGWYETRSIK